MRSRIFVSIAAFASVCLAPLALAQNPPAGPPKPGPEVKKLAAFVGKWTEAGEMKPGPMGPGGKFTGTDDCSWTAGGFALLCHDTGDMGAMGKSTGTAMMGYDAEAKTYIYCEVDSMGEMAVSHGKVDGDTWTWEADSTMGGQPMHSRFTFTFSGKDTFTMKYEGGPNASSMQVMMEGTGKRPAAAHSGY